MKCQRAEELFYEVGEDRLDPGTLAALRAHEASCSHCQIQFAAWRKYREALQSKEMRVTPPPDFTAGVMAQLEAEETAPKPVQNRQGLLATFQNSMLSKGLAAAAVVIALIMGPLIYAGKYLPDTTVPQIAQKEPQSKQVTPTTKTQNQESGKNAGEQAPEPTPSQTDNQDKAGPGEEIKEQPAATDSKVEKPSKPTQVAGNTGRTFNFLENKKRVITTSMVKLSVPNIEQAQKDAQAIAQSEGAQVTSTVTARNNGQPNLILRYTVSPAQAESLISRLEGLGTVKTRDQSAKDVTANFSRTLEEYRSLEAQIASASPSERERLKSQAEFLARQLEDWDQASEKQVIVLWLEN